MVKVVNTRREVADVNICRPTIYGNPFTHLVVGIGGGAAINVKDRDEAINRFAEWFYSERQRALRQRALLEIPDGAKLGCVCSPLRCHGDILAGYLNWKRNPEFNGPKARTVIWIK